jgi:hypothetical protein
MKQMQGYFSKKRPFSEEAASTYVKPQKISWFNLNRLDGQGHRVIEPFQKQGRSSGFFATSLRAQLR